MTAVFHRSHVFVCRSCRLAARRTSRRYQSTISSQTDPPEIYDVVTVGGGPVGLALLAALKSSPVTSHLRCALIEAQDLSKSRNWSMPPDQYSNRASSITPTNQAFLETIGAWQHLDQSRVQPYDEMQVWDAGNQASLQFDWRAEAAKYNAPPRTVATMVENLNLTRGLLERISELDAEDCLFSVTTVSNIENGQDDPDRFNLSSWPIVSVKTSDSTESTRLATRLLVGADGFNSPVRTFAGIASHGWDYDRHGVVATLKLDPPDQELSSFDDLVFDDISNRATAYQRFLPSLGGPIAVLPLPDNHASLVWSTTPETAARLKSLDSAAFVAVVNAALRLSQTDIKYILSLPSSSTTQQQQHSDELHWRLSHPPSSSLTGIPTISSVQFGSIASFPLRLRHTTSYIGTRVALAGDAAHTIHPLAGQGLNLGLADSSALVSAIAYGVEHGMDIGDPQTVLQRYAAQRYGHGLAMALGTDALNWVYQLGGTNRDSKGRSAAVIEGEGLVGTVVSGLRGLGMRVVNGVPGLKELVMRRAE